MSRFFVPISIEALKNKIKKCGPYNIKNITETVHKDLNKVQFDTENVSYSEAWCWNKKDSLVGYHTLDNKLTFLGVVSGGDWEIPIFLIVYFSGKELRGYIPKNGNTWNTINNSAFGNDEKKDLEFLSKKFSVQYKNFNKSGFNWKLDFVEQYSDYICLNRDELIKDIKSRIIQKN